jgi:hypothetical protein
MRNAALDITLTKRGQHDGEPIPMCGGGSFRIFEKKLVKVSHPKKQERIRMGKLHIKILLKHRRRRRPITGRGTGRRFLLGGWGDRFHGQKVAKVR